VLKPVAYVWHPNLFVTDVKVKRKKKQVGLGGKNWAHFVQEIMD